MTTDFLTRINFDWLPILPLLILTAGAIVVLLVGVRVNDRDSEGLGWLSLVAIAGAFVTTFMMLGSQQVSFSGALVADNFTAFFYAIILIAAAVTVLMSLDYIAEEGLPGAEYYALILFGTAGMLLMAAASDLIIVFLGLETMSISVYILAGLARTQERSNEAAMKYFLLGAFSTGFLLYGIALIYGAIGTIKLVAISTALAHGVSSPMLLLGVGLLLIGFGFKVAAVPFHMWTPDVYEGAPTSVTAFMAVGVKLAAFSAFLRVFLVHLLGVQADWMWVLWVLAVLTMTTGNIVALLQTNLKRMLAYSAIAHAGYILVAMTAGTSAAGSAILYYLLGYAFTNLGAFAIIIALGRRGHPNESISDLRGLEHARAGARGRDGNPAVLPDRRAAPGGLCRQVLDLLRHAFSRLCLAGGNCGAQQRHFGLLLSASHSIHVYGPGWRRSRPDALAPSPNRGHRDRGHRNDPDRHLSATLHGGVNQRLHLSLRQAPAQHHRIAAALAAT